MLLHADSHTVFPAAPPRRGLPKTASRSHRNRSKPAGGRQLRACRCSRAVSRPRCCGVLDEMVGIGLTTRQELEHHHESGADRRPGPAPAAPADRPRRAALAGCARRPARGRRPSRPAPRRSGRGCGNRDDAPAGSGAAAVPDVHPEGRVLGDVDQSQRPRPGRRLGEVVVAERRAGHPPQPVRRRRVGVQVGVCPGVDRLPRPRRDDSSSRLAHGRIRGQPVPCAP